MSTCSDTLKVYLPDGSTITITCAGCSHGLHVGMGPHGWQTWDDKSKKTIEDPELAWQSLDRTQRVCNRLARRQFRTRAANVKGLARMAIAQACLYDAFTDYAQKHNLKSVFDKFLDKAPF